MASDNFEKCLTFTLKYEGGKSNNPHDPGGRTMEGVTQRVYDAYRKAKGQPTHNVYSMNITERDDIYRHQYWDTVKADGLSKGEDLVMFDYAVNSGPGKANSVRRQVLNGYNPPKTTRDIVIRICQRRLAFLEMLRTWKYFGKGWRARVAACEALALKMASGIAAAPTLIAASSTAKIEANTSNMHACLIFAAGTALAIAAHKELSLVEQLILFGVTTAIAAVSQFNSMVEKTRHEAFLKEASK